MGRKWSVLVELEVVAHVGDSLSHRDRRIAKVGADLKNAARRRGADEEGQKVTKEGADGDLGPRVFKISAKSRVFAFRETMRRPAFAVLLNVNRSDARGAFEAETIIPLNLLIATQKIRFSSSLFRFLMMRDGIGRDRGR